MHLRERGPIVWRDETKKALALRLFVEQELWWPRFKWPVVKDEYHRDFVLDGSRTVVDVCDLPRVASQSR